MKKLFFLTILILLTASCAQKAVETGAPTAEPDKILEKAGLLQNSVRSVKGLASVSIKTPEDKISYTQVTLAEEPDLLRLEALNPFGSTVGFVSSDGENIYIVSQNGRGTYDINEVFDLSYVYPGLNLGVTIDQLVDLVSGRVPKDLFSGDKKPELSASEEGLVLNIQNGPGAEDDMLWINPYNNRVQKARIILDSGEPAEISYLYFDGLVDGHYFPKIVDFKTGELAITITYEPDVELNKSIDRTLLRP